MATLSVANLREHSGMNSKKSAESDTTSKKSSIHDGPSKPDGGKIKRLSIAPGPSSGPNQANIASLLMMKRKLSRWRANRMFSWNMSSVPTKKKPLENTFKMEPENNTKFCAVKIQTLVQDILEDMLQNQRGYDAKICFSMSQCITDTIKARVKGLGYHRYKLVVHVTMAQDSSQGLEVASRCVWDNERDNFATASYKTGDLVVIANVFGTYFE